jgi:molybdenum cofactor biosynthesis enzyme MoaA
MTGNSVLALAAIAVFASLVTENAVAADVSGNAKSACMVAVNSKYGGRVQNLEVVRSEFSQANSEVILSADGEHWRCLVSNDGEVAELTKQGGSHAAASTAASGKAENACMAAVDGNYGGNTSSLKIARTEPLPEKHQVIVHVVADGENWRCLASNDGKVIDLAVK